MDVKEETAAHSLLGRTLKNDWKVIRKHEKKDGDTGGFFSVCYTVSKNGELAFLKALNFTAFFQLFKGRPIIEILSEQTNAYKYEKDLLNRCKNNRLSKVSLIIDEGEEIVDDFTISNVPYLIFKIAEGDARSHMNFSMNLENSWKLNSLHNIAVGLKQLHGVRIGHQDLKPSNILLFQDGLVSKIGDLGRSLCSDIEAPHENNGNFPGDFSYSPPEFLYNFIEPDWNFRIGATDMYLFGSLVVFYFTGTNMTSLIGKNLDPQFKWTRWRGTFEQVNDYLINAFYKAIQEFKSSIIDQNLANELAEIIEYSCFPIPNRRGHPKTLKISNDKNGDRRTNLNQFDFRRIISKFDILTKRAKYNLNSK